MTRFSLLAMSLGEPSLVVELSVDLWRLELELWVAKSQLEFELWVGSSQLEFELWVGSSQLVVELWVDLQRSELSSRVVLSQVVWSLRLTECWPELLRLTGFVSE